MLDKKDMDAPHPKILIIRLSSIGDIVLTTPIIRALKQQLPNSQIHYLTKETNYILINNNPYVDKLFCYTNSLSETITELRKENYDYVIDLHKQIRSALICCLLHKKALHLPYFKI
jgi:ADP-heptose:LPS heptosyltransferase